MSKILWIVVPAAVVVAGAGVSYWLPGQYINKGFEKLEANSGSLVEASVTQTSGNVYDVSLQLADLPMPLAVNVKNVVNKSVWQSTITHEVFLDDSVLSGLTGEVKDWLQQNTIDNPIMAGSTTVDAIGNYHTSLTTFSVNDTFDDVTMTFKPMTIEFNGNGIGQLEYQAAWPGLNMVSQGIDAGELTVLPLNFEGKGKIGGGSVAPGKNSFSGEGFKVVSSTGEGEQLIDLGDYRLTSTVEEQDDRLSTQADIQIEKAIVDDGTDQPLAVEDLAIKLKLDGLESDNMQRLQQALDELRETGMPTEALQTEVNQLLRNGFRFEMNDWKVKLNDHSFKLDADVELTENTVADVQNPMSMLGILGNLSAHLNMAFAKEIADIPQLSSAMFSLMMTGSLVEDDDNYTMTFELENGLPQLNGEVLNIPGF